MSGSDNTGNDSFSGSQTYSNFCLDISDPYTATTAQIVLDGKVTYSGTYTGTSQDPTIESLNLSIVYLKVTYRDDFGTYSDAFAADFTFHFDTVTSSTVRWEYNGRIYKLTDDGSEDKLFHPDHGWVTFASNVNNTLCGNGLPSDGTMTITGKDGGAEFRFNTGDCGTYQVCLSDSSGLVDDTTCKEISW